MKLAPNDPRRSPRKPAPDNPRLLLQTLLRADFGAFLRKAYPSIKGGEDLVWNWHLAAIAHQLDLIASGAVRRSLITMPPRSLKSITISIAWVAWMLGHDPARNFVCVSYSNELSAKFARDCLSIMQSGWYRELFPNTIISAKRTAAHDFETTRGGGRLATSIIGTLTGRGGDIIIVDDPIKPDDVDSETAREAVNTWDKSTLASRLNDKATGSILVVMQRLHQFDLAGTMLEGFGWHQLKLQAIATEDQWIALPRGKIYRRREGELLHPARESQKELDEQKAMMGSAGFASQYQQDPLPALGNIILGPWLKTYTAAFDPDRMPGRIIQSYDAASKDGAHNDFSVCITTHVYRREIRVLDIMRQRLTFPELKREAIRLARQYRPKVILIEDQASGTQLIESLRSEQPRGVEWPIAFRPEGDKVSRMHGISAQIEAGQLMLPVDAPWMVDFKAELLGFPNTRHDDQSMRSAS